jgi:hypothetical protein
MKKLFEGSGALIVQALKLGAKASPAESGVEGLVASSKDGGAGAALDGFCEDAIAVVIV